MSVDIRDFVASDRAWARTLIGGAQGGDHHVARLGELLDPTEHEGIVAEVDGEPAALLTVAESEGGLEILTIHSAIPRRGAGTRLLETAVRVAAASGLPRVWLVTTNDNTDAIAWYLRRGLHVAAVHPGAVTADRAALKPAIPETNAENGLALRDLVELELTVDADGGGLRFPRFPAIADLDALPADSAAPLLGPLFEHAPRTLAAVVARRPFEDDAGLIRAAQDVARELPEDAQIELLDAHPRIGADPASVSALSHAEQGFDTPDDGAPWVTEELAFLNDAYERIFGFRFVIFVAGRPRSEIVPLLEAALRNERPAELRRGLDDVVSIAAHRLATLRSASAPG
ncbi:MAG TPA: GNAT family N-acetyltransferase [Candidatus Limnocylindria bacterium]